MRGSGLISRQASNGPPSYIHRLISTIMCADGRRRTWANSVPARRLATIQMIAFRKKSSLTRPPHCVVGQASEIGVDQYKHHDRRKSIDDCRQGARCHAELWIDGS